MKRLITIFAVCLSAAAFAQDSLHVIPPSVWVKADHCGSDTTFWKDISGNNHNVYPFAGQQLPVKGLLNFNPCYKLDGLVPPMWTEYNFTDKSRLTMVMVYQADDTLKELGIWSAHKGKNKPMSLSTQKFYGDRFHITYADSNLTCPVVNTMTSAWARIPNDTATHDTIYIGGNDSLKFTGKIAECLVYNDFIPARDLQRVQSYLCLKYGITLEGLDYLDSRKNVIWNKSLNSDYSNAIAGIGKDTIFGLNQKQSVSTSSRDIVTLSVGNPAPTNALNTSVINQADYIIWGNNNKPLTLTPIDTSGILTVLNRMWRVQVSGLTANSLYTSLKFDVRSIDYDSARIWLLIDTSGDGTLNLSEMNYIPSDSIYEGYAYFSNLQWDIDHNGKDLFTLMFDKTPPASANHPSASIITQLAGINILNEPARPGIQALPQITLSMLPEANDQLLHVNSKTQTSQSALSHLPVKGQGQIIYSLFPNPTDGRFTLNVTFEKENQVTISILDVQWNLLHQIKGTGKSVYNYVGDVPTSGSYFIDVQSDQQRRVFKLIVH
jgi:hypothetical protein